MSNDTSHKNTQILLGVIVGAHGVRGEVKIKSFTEYAEDMLAYGQLHLANGSPAPKITLRGEAKGQLIARIEGCHDRNAAEMLKGTEFFVDRDQLPDDESDDDAFYIEDLKGLAVRNESGEQLGQIVNVANYGAGDVVDIRFEQGGNRSYSFTLANFPQVNLVGGFVVFSAPEEIEAKQEKGAE